MGLLQVIDRVNAEHPWSHNDAYAGFVMKQACIVRRRGGECAVDVGCGTGNLLALLAEVFPDTVGIEPDAETAAAAARRFETSDVRVVARAFGEEPIRAYDLVVFVASLHHMPLEPALSAARASLRPGGRIVIVGVAAETPRDAVRSWASVLLNPLIGLVRHPARAQTPPASMHAPTAVPSQTFAEIRDVATTILPGVRMRRRLFWRYTATWTAPA